MANSNEDSPNTPTPNPDVHPTYAIPYLFKVKFFYTFDILNEFLYCAII